MQTTDMTVKKVSATHAPMGEMGQRYLVSGKGVAMRRWDKEPTGAKEATCRDYETVGYVMSGRALLEIEGQTVLLEAGDAWLVPKGASHRYEILTPFTAIEATSPPAHAHARDE